MSKILYPNTKCLNFTTRTLQWSLQFVFRLFTVPLLSTSLFLIFPKVDNCIPIISYSGIVYHIIFKRCLRSSTLFNKTNIIHTTTSVLRRLNILCTILKIIAFFITTLINQSYARVDRWIILAWQHHVTHSKSRGP